MCRAAAERKNMSDDLLVVSRISKTFVGVQALDHVDLAIRRAEIHCLVGENGSGKSTLIKIISGAEQPDEGEVLIDGRSISSNDSRRSIRNGVEVIYQDLSLFPDLTVAENIAVTQRTERGEQFVKWRETNSIAVDAMKRVGLNIDPASIVGRLSVANQQLVAICRALTSQAKLLIMDEPTTALTKHEIDNLFSVIMDLKAKGIAVMFVSHKLNEILQIAERVTILRDGKIVGTFDKEGITTARLETLMTGKAIELGLPLSPIDDSKVLLEVRGLCRRDNYSNVCFRLHRGEILGITGLLGSGRTELALSLFGLNSIDAGQIFVEGKLVRIRTVREAIRLGIDYVPEDRLKHGLVMPQSIEMNLIITVVRSLLGRLGLISRKKRQEFAARWIQTMGMKVSDVGAPVLTLSGGNQQRIVIAKWLATRPKILILDGPTIGIDVSAKSSIHDMIKNLAADGLGVILISDEVAEVLSNCHRVLLMKYGRIISEFDTGTTSKEQIQDAIEAG